MNITGRLLSVHVLIEINDAQLHQALGPARRVLLVAVRRSASLGYSIGLADEKYRSASQTNGHLKSSGFRVTRMRDTAFGCRRHAHSPTRAGPTPGETRTGRERRDNTHTAGGINAESNMAWAAKSARTDSFPLSFLRSRGDRCILCKNRVIGRSLEYASQRETARARMISCEPVVDEARLCVRDDDGRWY